MALQVWLPLNGNLNNQGVENPTITNSGATVDSSGKLGKCYSFGGSAYIKGSYNLSKTQSFACWVYFPNSVPAGKHLFDARSGDSTGYQPMYINSDKVQIGGGNTYVYISYKFAANTWYHICTTFDETQGSLYVNGSLIGTAATPSVTTTGSCNFTLCSRLNQANYCTAKMNDVRIYNHCLSPKEVKEISKGLVLHYPMNNCNIEANNLLNNASSYREGTPYNCTTTSADDYFHTNMYYNNDSLGGQTVTFSVSTNKQIAPSHGGSSSTHDKVGFWLYLKKTAYSSPDGSYDTPINLNSSNNNFKSLGNNRYSWTYTIPSGYKGVMIRTNLYSNNGSSVSADFWDFQLEFGSKASPFSPNNWTSATVYDCSGFGYNGTVTSTTAPILDSDSPRYSGSFNFNGNKYITVGDQAKITDGISVCWWGKMSNWTNYGRAVSVTESGGWNFEPNNGKMYFPLFTNEQYYGAIDSVSLTSLSSGWHHWVGTYDKNSVKLYRDGSLVGTTNTNTNTPIGYNTNYMFIGAESAETSCSGPYFDGSISDFRIYSTALSAEDVKELYNTSAIICDNGTVMAYSLEE